MAASVMFLGWKPWWDYLDGLRRSTTVHGAHGIQPELMFNLKSVLLRVAGPDALPTINRVALIGLAVGFVLVYAALRHRALVTRYPGVALSICVLAGVLLSPHLYIHDVSVVLVAFFLVIQALRSQPIAKYIVAGMLLFPMCTFGDVFFFTPGVLPQLSVLLLAVLLGSTVYGARRLTVAPAQD